MNDNDKVITFFAVLGLLFAALVVVVLNDFINRRQVRRAEARQKTPPARIRNNRTNWGLVLTLVVLAPLFLYIKLFTNWIERAPRGAEIAKSVLRWMPAIVIAASFAFVLYITKQLIANWWKNRHVLRAYRILRAGDAAGAIAMLREKLQADHPSPEILNGIAAFYCDGKDWDNALRTICEAEENGLDYPNLKATKGVILWKMGRLGEAVEVLRAAHGLLPHDLFVACNYGTLLAEMGQTDKAKEVLRWAESKFKNTYYLGKGQRRMNEDQLDAFRQKVAAAREGNGEIEP